MMKAIVFLIGIIHFGLVSAANYTVTAVQDLWPPFVTGNPDKPGISVEIVREALKTQGYDLTIEIYPWARAVQSVKEGQKDIVPGIWHTQERENLMHLSQSYAVNEVKFVVARDSKIEYSGFLDSLTGKQIGVIREYGYGEEFNNSDYFFRQKTNSFVLNVQKLIKGRVDMTLEDELVAKSLLIEENAGLLDKIKFLEPPLSERNLYVASAKKNNKSKKIIAAFNKGLQEIKENGLYERIFEKYLKK